LWSHFVWAKNCGEESDWDDDQSEVLGLGDKEGQGDEDDDDSNSDLDLNLMMFSQPTSTTTTAITSTSATTITLSNPGPSSSAAHPYLCEFCKTTLSALISPALRLIHDEHMLPANSCPLPTPEHVNGCKHASPCGWQLRVELCGGHICEQQVQDDSAGKEWLAPDSIDYNILDAHVCSLEPQLSHTIHFSWENILFQHLAK
jgi:hypothetical protein